MDANPHRQETERHLTHRSRSIRHPLGATGEVRPMSCRAQARAHHGIIATFEATTSAHPGVLAMLTKQELLNQIESS
jgi:hypothetical protein